VSMMYLKSASIIVESFEESQSHDFSLKKKF